MVVRSMVVAAEASSQSQAMMLKPAARVSAMTPTKLLGPGTKAKKRGWLVYITLGKTSRSSSSSTAAGSAPASGAGPARLCSRARQPARPVTGLASRVAR